MSRNYKVQLFLDLKNALKVQEYEAKRGYKSDSEAISHIVSEYFMNLDQQDQAVNRLNKVIQGFTDKIKNLEYENRLLKEKTPPKPPKKKKEVKT